MLIERESSCVLAVDVQERLVMSLHHGDRVVVATAWLVEIATELGVPVMASEQYPRGLGHTVDALRPLLPEGSVVEKVAFSCVRSGDCYEHLRGLGRKQVILTGAETHVCVLQTALQLKEEGYQVFVVADAVGSRRDSDRELALQRMRDAGVVVVTREMVAFEWLRQAGTDEFRSISKRFLK